MQKPDVASSINCPDDSTNSDITKENVVLPIAVEDTHDRLIVVVGGDITYPRRNIIVYCIFVIVLQLLKSSS